MLRIFLSHVRDDGVLARRLAEALKRAGHQPLLVEDAARVGESALEVLERCLSESDAAILCLSRTSLADAWMQTEFQKVLQWAGGSGQTVMAVRFERVVPPEALAHCLSVDMFPHGSAWDDGASVLLEVLESFDSGRSTQRGALRLGNLPPPPKVFVGRKELLRRLHEILESSPENAGGRRATLVGEEGTGLSSTALQFSHESAEQFPGGRWWCDARGRTADTAMALLLPALQRLAPLGLRAVLDSVSLSSPPNEAAQAVRQALTQLPLPSLLVIDDAEQRDWNRLLPDGRVRILMARHEMEGAIGEVLPLGPLSSAESLELMDALSTAPQAPEERAAQVRVIEDLLDGQPFTVSLMSTLQRDSGASWSMLEQALRSRLPDPLPEGDDRQVSTAVDEALDRCTSAMRQGLEAVACFEAVIPVPSYWVAGVLAESADGGGLDQAFWPLLVAKLVRWDEPRDMLSLHPLVRRRVRERMEATERERLLRRSLEVMALWISSRIADVSPENLLELETLQPHFQQSLRATEHWPPFRTWVVLAIQAAHILELRLELPAALALAQRALERAEALSAPREQFHALVGLTSILHKMGREEEASSYLQRAVQLADALPAQDEQGFVASLNKLAILSGDQDLGLARRLAERAVQEAERLTQPHEALTGAVLATLALTRAATGEPAAALPLMERALESTARAKGPDSFFFVEILSQQAQILMLMNDWPRARTVLEEACATAERLLPPDHFELGKLLASLAGVLLNLGEFEGAAPLLERALAILEAKLGPEHPGLVTVLYNLGLVRVRAKRMEEAKAALSRALKLLETFLSWDKQFLAAVQMLLGIASESLGESQAAMQWMESALDAGLPLYVPGDGPGRVSLERALRLVRARQVNPSAYASALAEALETAERAGDAANAAKAALLLGAFEGRRGAWETARRQAERGLRWAKQAEIAVLVAESHRLLGDSSLHGSRYEDARLHYAEAIRRFQELELPSRASRTRMLLLVMLLQLGRTEALSEHAAALQTALDEGRFADPTERTEVEQVLRLVDAAQRGAQSGPPGNTK